MGRWIDLTGQRFGKLTAYSYSHVELSTGRKMAAWLCVCDCGNKKIIQAHHLRGGKSRSCGCSLFEEKKPGGDRRKWPGYGIWWQMIQRCSNPNVNSYKHYGGRGVSVCDRWRHGTEGTSVSGFECFFEDMGPPPAGLTLDRIDCNGNYEPANCRWATAEQQRTNTRRSIHAIIGGVRVPLKKYAGRLGLNYEGVRLRVRKKGMTVQQAARAMLAASVLAFFAVTAPEPAKAHDWFPYSCCSGFDCRIIPADHVKTTAKGFLIPGNPEIVPYNSPKIRQTPPEGEGAFALCTKGGTVDGEVICLYIPTWGS